MKKRSLAKELLRGLILRAMLLLSACGEERPVAAECLELIKQLNQMSAATGERTGNEALLEELIDKWQDLDAAEEQRAINKCRNALALMQTLADDS